MQAGCLAGGGGPVPSCLHTAAGHMTCLPHCGVPPATATATAGRQPVRPAAERQQPPAPVPTAVPATASTAAAAGGGFARPVATASVYLHAGALNPLQVMLPPFMYQGRGGGGGRGGFFLERNLILARWGMWWGGD